MIFPFHELTLTWLRSYFIHGSLIITISLTAKKSLSSRSHLVMPPILLSPDLSSFWMLQGMICDSFENEIHLQLIQSQSLLPCDEFTTFIFPNQDHPPPLSLDDQMNNSIPMLLRGSCLCNQGMISLRYLSFNLVLITFILFLLTSCQVFQCSWPEVQTSECDKKFIVVGKTNGVQKFSISLQMPEYTHEQVSSEGSSLPPTTTSVPSFMSPARETIFQIASVTCFQPSKWIGSHTLLLSSAPGSGKTTLLSNIHS